MKKKLAGVLVLSMLAGSIGSLPAETFAKGTEGQEVFSVSDNVAWLGGWDITPQTELAGMTISDSKKEELIARLEDGIRNRQSSIDISDLYCDKPIVAAAIPEMLNRNPDFFYVDGWFSTNSGGTDYVRTVFPKYCVRYPEGSGAEFEAAVQGYMDEIDPSWNDYEKALYLHDALCRDMEYDDDLERHNAYNALVEHYGVCVSYATGYTVLCRAAGIPCDYVVSRNGEHCWNIITLGGKKYYVDCTWDDKPGKYFRHTYFLNSRDKFGHDSKYDKNNNLIDTTDWSA